MAGVVFSGQSSGCLLPILIIMNLLFGRVFFRSMYIWLGLEILLITVFCVKAYIWQKSFCFTEKLFCN